jgi:hypothetical protein
VEQCLTEHIEIHVWWLLSRRRGPAGSGQIPIIAPRLSRGYGR